MPGKSNKITEQAFRDAVAKLKRRFELEPPLIEDSARKLCFVGDVHGDIETINYVKGISEKFERIVWLGDFVDRGAFDIEVVVAIAGLSISKNIILAGNHDIGKEVYPRDFDFKLREHFGSAWEELESLYISAFKVAPIAYFNTHYSLLALHGFIPLEEGDWDIKAWKKPNDGGDVVFQILWNDPAEAALGWRGEGTHIISSDATEKFFQQTGITIIIRSHQPRVNQIFNFKNGKLVNLGSSSYYGKRAIFVLPEFEFIYF